MKIGKNIVNERAGLRVEQNQLAIEHIKSQKKKITKKSKDNYTTSPQPRYFNYTKKYAQKSRTDLYEGYLPMEFINLLNGDDDSEIGVYIDGDSLFEYKGIRFTRKNIPEIPESEFEEIKAVNNVIDFGKSNYFKYVSRNGKEYRLYSTKKGCISSLETDRLLKKENDLALQRYAHFWNWCMEDVTTLNNNAPAVGFTRKEEQKYLEEMGVGYGFVTIKMGNRENTLFRTKSKWHGELINKYKYDSKYEYMRTSVFGKQFGAGAVITIGGKEYIFDANCQIDIPYGADIYDVKYPPTLDKRSDM